MNNPDLLSTALTLREQARRPCRLNPLILMTDPARIADPLGLIASLPPNIDGQMAVIFRHFGDENRRQTASALRQLSFERQMQLLIGNDPELAVACGADGVHFGRTISARTLSLWKKRCPDWILSQAGKKDPLAYIGPGQSGPSDSKDLKPLDAVLISSLFESASPSAGSPIGLGAFHNICQKLEVPVFALGGINADTARGLIGSGAAGLAAVSAFAALAVKT